MPELPEVETTRRGIEPCLKDRTIEAVIVRNPALRWPIPATLAAHAKGQRVRSVGRRAKYILMELGEGWIILHLGMSGSLRIVNVAEPAQKHDHLDLVLDNETALRLRDPRRFGAVLWTDANPGTHPLLRDLGIEPLSDAFDGAWLHSRLRGRQTAIKLALMDSRLVVGVGNIYANEALFEAGIRPTLAAGRLSRTRCNRLAAAIKDVLERAIAAGGSTLRDFVDSNGRPGYFQQQYRVYGRTSKPCRICGSPIRQVRQGQRSTFFCSRCQT